MPFYNSSNPWRSHSQPPPPSRTRPPAPPRPPSASQPATPPEPAHDPDDDRTRALAGLARLEARFRSLARAFAPPAPAQLAFTPKASAAAPKLAYTPGNASVHGYEEALTRLLTELDAIESGGDDEVRATRKALVRAVEGEAQRVEQWRRACWEARERGEDGSPWVKTVDAKALDGEVEPVRAGRASDGRDGAGEGRTVGQDSGMTGVRSSDPDDYGPGAKLDPRAVPSPTNPGPTQAHPQAQTRPHSGGQPYRPSPASAFAPGPQHGPRDRDGAQWGAQGDLRTERDRDRERGSDARGPRWAGGGGAGQGAWGGAGGGRDGWTGRRSGGPAAGGGWW
ncbi:hypothetical protein JCM3770_006981 [Rhodotorula araucariae]